MGCDIIVKTIITLEDGTKADVDVDAYSRLKEGMKEGNSKKIVMATVECLMSSDVMMDDLTDKISRGMTQFSKMAEYPWIIMDANKGQIFLCKRCKEEHKLNMENMSIDEFCRLSNAFIELHKECKDERK